MAKAIVSQQICINLYISFGLIKFLASLAKDKHDKFKDQYSNQRGIY